MRVVVTGGRDYRGRAVWFAMSGHAVAEVACGAATGADALAIEAAEELGIPMRLFPADWKKHGRAAGPIRNGEMLREFKPDVVWAFPGGRGTADCVRQAKALGIPVVEMDRETR